MHRILPFLPPIICLVLGGVLIAFGVHVDENYATNSSGFICAYAFICIGCVPYLFFIFLCVGLALKNSCCLVVFLIFQILAIIGQIIIVYLLTMDTAAIASNLANIIDISWENELNNPGAMSIYESTYNCCGRASPLDYIVNNRLPPKSCFINGAEGISENLIGESCRILFESHIVYLLHIFCAISWILVVMEVIVSCLSCVILCNK